uniref:C-type lectin domain-containing protein n=1 Tax=Seriola dumerili TaxID=41447 RepID=A0A3B4T801_SERDU
MIILLYVSQWLYFVAWLLYDENEKQPFFPSGLSAGSARILKEYVYVNMPKTWAEAQSYCREMFNDLATVTNRDFNSRLLSVIQGHGHFVWIGLHDERTKWEWSLNNRDFNTNTDFNRWKLDEPNNWEFRKQCTVITRNGYWLDFSCMELFPAVCLKGKKD